MLTLTSPGVTGGVIALTVVSLRNRKAAAGVASKFTAVTPVNPLPVIVMTFPPAIEPDVGLILVIIGSPKREEDWVRKRTTAERMAFRIFIISPKEGVLGRHLVKTQHRRKL